MPQYLPLFRKYRPQSFADLVGQENLVRALSNAIELKRIAPAYLFCGPRGTGKTSSARIFAKSLNCEHGPTVTPCQECASCVDITNTTGMDVIEIDAATNRGVEGAEDLIAQVHYAPVGGKYKIFIIDEVHMLTTTAFNALLKTFEEPPSNVIFILATTEPHKVLETIVSRCQRFDFRRITVDDIVGRLRQISDTEKIKITDDALFSVAKNVSGGLRDSLALLDQVSILGAKEEITKDMIEELLGKVTFDKLLNLLDFIVANDIENSLKLIDKIYTQGSEPRNLCENFMEFLRNVIVILNSKNAHDVVAFSALSTQDIDKIIEKKYDISRVMNILNIAIEYFREVKFATNPYLWVELMVIQAAKGQTEQLTVAPAQKPTPVVPAQKTPAAKPEASVIEPLIESEGKPATPAPEPKKEPVQEITPPVGEPVGPEVISTINTGNNDNPIEIWSTIVNSIESIPAKFFYSGMAKLVGVEENRVILGFINQNVIAQAKSDLKHKALLDGESKAYGGKYSFEFVQLTNEIKPIEGAVIKPVVKPAVSSAPAAQKSTQLPAESKNSADSESSSVLDATDESIKPKENINNAIYSPKVKEMLEAFSGKIID